MLDIILFNNLKKKNSIFRENSKKVSWGTFEDFFRERKRLVPKINMTFFYHKWDTEYEGC